MGVNRTANCAVSVGILNEVKHPRSYLFGESLQSTKAFQTVIGSWNDSSSLNNDTQSKQGEIIFGCGNSSSRFTAAIINREKAYFNVPVVAREVELQCSASTYVLVDGSAELRFDGYTPGLYLLDVNWSDTTSNFSTIMYIDSQVRHINLDHPSYDIDSFSIYFEYFRNEYYNGILSYCDGVNSVYVKLTKLTSLTGW